MIHPIQAFKEMPTKKKVATVVGTAAAAGAIAAGTAAFIKGGKTETFEKLGDDTKAFKKFTTRMAEGFKTLKSDITAKIPNFFKKGQKAAENAADAAEKVQA